LEWPQWIGSGIIVAEAAIFLWLDNRMAKNPGGHNRSYWPSSMWEMLRHWLASVSLLLEWGIPLGAGIAMGQWDEFALALFFFGVASVALALRTIFWKGKQDEPRATIALKILGVVGAGLFFLLLLATWSPTWDQYFTIANAPLTIVKPVPLPSWFVYSAKTPGIGKKEQKPDIDMALIYPTDFAILLLNRSSVVLNKPKWSPALWDLDRLDTDGRPTILPVPVAEGDWIRPHEALGPEALISEVQSLVNPNDRIFGFISVSCPECARTRVYWVYAVAKKGGWFSECKGGYPDLAAISRNIKLIRNDPDPFLKTVPTNARISIYDSAGSVR
jgi:hypothetical protein